MLRTSLGIWTTRTQDNSYPLQLVPRTTRTQDNSYPGQLLLKTTRTQDNSYPGQLLPKTTRTKDNSFSVMSVTWNSLSPLRFIRHTYVWYPILTHNEPLCFTPSLHWRYNGRDGVSNHQPHYCLLNRLFRSRSKKTSKLPVTGLCGEFTGDRWISRTNGQ